MTKFNNEPIENASENGGSEWKYNLKTSEAFTVSISITFALLVAMKF